MGVASPHTFKMRCFFIFQIVTNNKKKRARCGRRVLPTRNGVLKVGIIAKERNSSVHNPAIIQQIIDREILKNVF
jgi:hypothetical protein